LTNSENALVQARELSAGLRYTTVALEDCAFLLTIAWPEGEEH
jgi:hypothetical protein